MAFAVASALAPNTVNSSVGRTREYLTANEVEELMGTARESSRYGHRDATMILNRLPASSPGGTAWPRIFRREVSKVSLR